MKLLITVMGGLGILGVVLLAFVPFFLTFYGLYLAFSASIILGVLALLIEPSPFILGLLAVLGHKEVAEKIATWLGI